MQQPRQKPRGRNRVLTFAQSFRHKRTALAALAILLSILLRELLLWQEAHGTRKHILVLSDPVAKENPLHFHDLHVMAEYMAAAGFQVTEADSQPYHFRDRDDEALWRGLLEYDVIVTQGLSGMAVGDYAARANRPVARFIADPEAGLLDPVDPASERPDIMVLGHNGGEKAHDFTSHFAYARQRKIPTFPHLMTAGHPEVKAFMRDLEAIPQHTVHCSWDEKRGDVLGLVMVVKNETERINSTLLHLRDFTDFYTVVDTASEDNTLEVVRELMSGIPGQIVQHGPLKSFADARNHAFKAHGNRTQWVLMADADVTVHNAWRLRAFAQRMVFHCELAPTASCNRCFRAVAKYGIEWLDVSRIFPTKGAGTKRGWHYKYPVVESLRNKHGWEYQMLHALNMTVALHPDGRPTKRQAEFDLPTLIKERARNTSCERTAFFLAVMHHNVGHLEEAFKAYGQRLTMGGTPEELYECHLRRGKLQRYWGQDPRLELLESSKVLPYRAEPLYDLAHYHSAMSATSGCPASPLPGATPMNDTCALIHIVAAFHYIRKAAALPIPTAETLYLDASLYEYRSVELLTEVSMSLVWRLVSAGVNGRLGALEVMRSVDTITGRMLYRRGEVLLKRLEEFHKNVTHDLVWIGLSGGGGRS